MFCSTGPNQPNPIVGTGENSTPAAQPEGASNGETQTAGMQLTDFVMQLEDYTPTVSENCAVIEIVIH